MKIFILIFICLNLYGLTQKEAFSILDKNDTKEIKRVFNSKDGFDLIMASFIKKRGDILDTAVKNGFDITQTNKFDFTLLDFASYYAYPYAIKKLIPYINPNHISKKRYLNSLRIFIEGVRNNSNTNKNEVIDVAKILRKNYAKFDVKDFSHPNII